MAIKHQRDKQLVFAYLAGIKRFRLKKPINTHPR